MTVHISGAEMHYISRGQFLGRLISVNIHVSGANIVHECEYICICMFTCLGNVLCYQSAFIPRYKFLHTNICPFMSMHWFLGRFVLIFTCFLYIIIWVYLHLHIYANICPVTFVILLHIFIHDVWVCIYLSTWSRCLFI